MCFVGPKSSWAYISKLVVIDERSCVRKGYGHHIDELIDQFNVYSFYLSGVSFQPVLFQKCPVRG